MRFLSYGRRLLRRHPQFMGEPQSPASRIRRTIVHMQRRTVVQVPPTALKSRPTVVQVAVKQRAGTGDQLAVARVLVEQLRAVDLHRLNEHPGRLAADALVLGL